MKNDVVFGIKDEREITDQEWLDWKKELDEAKEYYDSIKVYSVFWKDVEVNDLYLTEPEAYKLATTWREITQCEDWRDVEIRNMASIINSKDEPTF